MLFSVLSCLGIPSAPVAEIRALFIGNSHTMSNNVPGMVKSLVESGGQKIFVETVGGDLLNNIAARPEVIEKVKKGRWNFVILQGASVSQSHKTIYPYDHSKNLAAAATKAGAVPLLYAEWSRKGIDETEYIIDIYRLIQKGSSARIVTVGRVWDQILKQDPKLDLWIADGNHAKPVGSYIAACSFYYSILGKDAPFPTFKMSGLDQKIDRLIKNTAKSLTSK